MKTGLTAPTAAPRDESARKYFREVMDGKNLPSLPMVANKVLEMVKDPDCNIEKLRRVLAADTALAARVLAISRSPNTVSEICRRLFSARCRCLASECSAALSLAVRPRACV